MKITLSKKQWESIGKKTGWIKIAQETPSPYEVLEVTKREQSDKNTYDFVFEISGPILDYTVNATVTFKYEPAQHGGRTDPSWGAHYYYSGLDIIDTVVSYDANGNATGNIIGETTEITEITKNEQDGIEECINNYLVNNSEDCCEEMIDSAKEEDYNPPDIDPDIDLNYVDRYAP